MVHKECANRQHSRACHRLLDTRISCALRGVPDIRMCCYKFFNATGSPLSLAFKDEPGPGTKAAARGI